MKSYIMSHVEFTELDNQLHQINTTQVTGHDSLVPILLDIYINEIDCVN